MTKEKLIEAIRAIQDDGTRLGEIEKEVKVPRNTLSGMLNGTKPFKEKWQRKLTAYVQSKKKENSSVKRLDVNIQTSDISEKLPSRETPKERPLPPPGLSKAETIKWHRQHSQTLQ